MPELPFESGWYEITLNPVTGEWRLHDDDEPGWAPYGDDISGERDGWGNYKVVVDEEDLIIQVEDNRNGPFLWIYRWVP